MAPENDATTIHLTDDELLALALPPTGAPEPLPLHLSGCLRCSRVLADWKSALQDLGAEDEDTVARRSADEWEVAEGATLAAVRAAGPAGRRRSRTLGWAIPVAASLVLFALLLAGRPAASPPALDDTAGLSAEDRADDALLRDVDRLASGEDSDGGWSSLAPDPEGTTSPPAAEQRS